MTVAVKYLANVQTRITTESTGFTQTKQQFRLTTDSSVKMNMAK